MQLRYPAIRQYRLLCASSRFRVPPRRHGRDTEAVQPHRNGTRARSVWANDALRGRIWAPTWVTEAVARARIDALARAACFRGLTEAVVSVGVSVRDAMAERVGADASRHKRTVVHNGVHTNRFQSGDGASGATTSFLFIGMMGGRHGSPRLDVCARAPSGSEHRVHGHHCGKRYRRSHHDRQTGTRTHLGLDVRSSETIVKAP